MEDKPKITVIIPVFREARIINECILNVRSCLEDTAHEIVIIDGAPQACTIAACNDSEIITLSSSPGRAAQMNTGARHAQGELLLFLHADTRLPPKSAAIIERELKNARLGAFSLKIVSHKYAARYLSAWATARSRYLGLPYGDQAFFMRRADFEKFKGFKELPIMEDVDLVRRVHRIGKVATAAEHVCTSARRWEVQGYLRRSILNGLLLAGFYLGIPCSLLCRAYPIVSKS